MAVGDLSSIRSPEEAKAFLDITLRQIRGLDDGGKLAEAVVFADMAIGVSDKYPESLGYDDYAYLQDLLERASGGQASGESVDKSGAVNKQDAVAEKPVDETKSESAPVEDEKPAGRLETADKRNLGERVQDIIDEIDAIRMTYLEMGLSREEAISDLRTFIGSIRMFYRVLPEADKAKIVHAQSVLRTLLESPETKPELKPEDTDVVEVRNRRTERVYKQTGDEYAEVSTLKTMLDSVGKVPGLDKEKPESSDLADEEDKRIPNHSELVEFWKNILEKKKYSREKMVELWEGINDVLMDVEEFVIDPKKGHLAADPEKREKIEKIKSETMNPAIALQEALYFEIVDNIKNSDKYDWQPILDGVFDLKIREISEDHIVQVIEYLNEVAEWVTPQLKKLVGEDFLDDLDPEEAYYKRIQDQFEDTLKIAKERKEEFDRAKGIEEALVDPRFETLQNLIALVPKKRPARIKDEMPIEELARIETELKEEYSRLVDVGIIGGLGDKNAEIIDRKYKLALEQLKSLKERRPVYDMNLEELTSEIIKDGYDPFRWADLKVPAGESERTRAVMNKYKAEVLQTPSVETMLEDPKAEINRIFQKVRLQINVVANTLMGETGKASGDRTKLFSELMRTQVARHELLLATTNNPEWGVGFSKILEALYKTAALRSGEVVVSRGGKEVKILETDVLSSDNVLYEFDSDLSYNSLAGESGQTNLARGIDKFDEKYGFKLTKEVKTLIGQIFLAFDYLTISLTELQKNTCTRAHNTSAPDKDRVMMDNPLASMVHRTLRYGGNEDDWSLWFLVYMEDIPAWEDSVHGQRYGKDEEDHEWLRHKQKMLKAHQSVFYPIEPFAGGVELPGFCESLGLNTASLLKINEGERLWLIEEESGDPSKPYRYATTGGKKVADFGDPERSKQGKHQNIAPMEFFPLAEENGWGNLLELMYKAPSSGNITEKEILTRTKAGTKGGLLGEFFQICGRAKMFPGKHLETFIEPMLTHFIFKLFQLYEHRENKKALQTLWYKVIGAIDSSARGGLSAYSDQLYQVVLNISQPSSVRGIDPEDKKRFGLARDNGEFGEQLAPKENYRDLERKKYLNMWWEEEQGRSSSKKERPPRTVLNVRLPGRHNLDSMLHGEDLLAEEYMEYLNGAQLPAPASSQGDMLQPKETAST